MVNINNLPFLRGKKIPKAFTTDKITSWNYCFSLPGRLHCNNSARRLLASSSFSTFCSKTNTCGSLESLIFFLVSQFFAIKNDNPVSTSTHFRTDLCQYTAWNIALAQFLQAGYQPHPHQPVSATLCKYLMHDFSYYFYWVFFSLLFIIITYSYFLSQHLWNLNYVKLEACNS